MKIEEMGYVDDIRERLGLEPGDTSLDKEIEAMAPFQRVRMLAGWNLGDPYWADTFRSYFESQGLFLTTNPDADGVLKDGEE